MLNICLIIEQALIIQFMFSWILISFFLELRLVEGCCSLFRTAPNIICSHKVSIQVMSNSASLALKHLLQESEKSCKAVHCMTLPDAAIVNSDLFGDPKIKGVASGKAVNPRTLCNESSLYTGSPFSVLYHNLSMRQNTVLFVQNTVLIGGIKKEIEVELGKRRACIGKSREGRRVVEG